MMMDGRKEMTGWEDVAVVEVVLTGSQVKNCADPRKYIRTRMRKNESPSDNQGV